MNVISSDQVIDFFIAYLARHAEQLSVEIPTDRGCYQIIKANSAKRRGPYMQLDMQFDHDVVLKARTDFPDPAEPGELDRLAEDLAERVDQFERDKDEMIDNLHEFRAHAQKMFGKLPAKSPLKFVSLDIVIDEWEREARCVMSYEMLGEGAQPVIGTANVFEKGDIESELSFRRDTQAVLASHANELKREKADGAIDAVLVSLLENDLMDPVAIFESAQNDNGLIFIQSERSELSLFWKDGTLTAGFPLNENIKYHGGIIMVHECPAHLSGDLAGRKVSDLIVHPELPEDLIFDSGTAIPGRRGNFDAQLQFKLLDLRSRTIW